MPIESLAGDPSRFAPVRELLGLVFGPDLLRREALASRVGPRWEEASTAFVERARGGPIAHVGVLELPMVLAGRETTVGGIHAVATHPAHRGRGHMRRLMEEALAWCDARWETLVLTAGEPAIYERFGFRVLQEHRFVGRRPACERRGFRPLRLEEQADVRLHRLLEERTPVSHRLGMMCEKPVFLYNEAIGPPHYAEDLECIACYGIEEGTLRLFDLVAPELPTLEEVCARIPGPEGRLEVYLTPDRLEADLAAEPHLFGGDDYVMVRGPFAPEGQPVFLPRSARC